MLIPITAIVITFILLLLFARYSKLPEEKLPQAVQQTPFQEPRKTLEETAAKFVEMTTAAHIE